jgi:hypothetical protein
VTIIEWTSTHKATTTLVILPLLGAILNSLFKPRTTEELARIPRWAQVTLTALRTLFPDPAPLLALFATILLRRPDVEIPIMESLPPPPYLPKDSKELNNDPQ